MKIYSIHIKKSEEHAHFCEESAKGVIAKSKYTDKSGTWHAGQAHWSPEQIEGISAGLKFPEGTTLWDKYVAFNSMYFDLCKVLEDPIIVKVAHAFYFADEDAPQVKIKRYIDAMHNL